MQAFLIFFRMPSHLTNMVLLSFLHAAVFIGRLLACIRTEFHRESAWCMSMCLRQFQCLRPFNTMFYCEFSMLIIGAFSVQKCIMLLLSSVLNITKLSSLMHVHFKKMFCPKNFRKISVQFYFFNLLIFCLHFYAFGLVSESWQIQVKECHCKPWVTTSHPVMFHKWFQLRSHGIHCFSNHSFSTCLVHNTQSNKENGCRHH